ncbi:hypothetical protein diail_5043 [Diaporthe ilicicola]|nr:hypothetical protein diail_5043 [Diaporthe ilicicola]
MPSSNLLDSPQADVLEALVRHRFRNLAVHSHNFFQPSSVDGLAQQVIELVAHGARQSDVRRELSTAALPDPSNPVGYGFCSEVASWIFATVGVLCAQHGLVLVHQPTESANGGSVQVNGTTGDQSANQNQVTANSATSPVANSGPFCLPKELLDQVLENLAAQDINDLRLSCREFRGRTFSFWAKTYFSKRQFMVDLYSLQTLLEITRHRELSKVLTHLIIGVDEINGHDTLKTIHFHFQNNPRLPAVFDYWQTAVSAQHTLLVNGSAIALLSEAMTNLPNLKTIGISGSKLDTQYPFPANPSINQYPHLGLRSYGSSAYSSQAREASSRMPNSTNFVDRIFNLVLGSLLVSEPKITRFETKLAGFRPILPLLDDGAFSLLPPLSPGTTTLLGGLSHLHLDVSLESVFLRSIGPLRHAHGFISRTSNLRRFLGFTCNLESLGLTFSPGLAAESHCDFVSWLCEPGVGPIEGPGEDIDNTSSDRTALNRCIPAPITLPSLRKLDLKGLHTSPSRLGAIFKKFSGLESCVLSEICLRLCPIDRLLGSGGASDETENLWSSFLCNSHAALENLTRLDLSDLAVRRFWMDPNGMAEGVSDSIIFVRDHGAMQSSCRSITVEDFGQDALEELAAETWLLAVYDRWRESQGHEDDREI